MDIPDVHYARSGDVAIAYQVIGDGSLDVVLVPDWVSNLVWAWHTPYWRSFYERLSAFARVIVFDKRGTGLSDRPRFFPDLETRTDDLRAVLDAVGSERAALVASHEGCWMASLFAATYPERTRSLALYHPWLGRSDSRISRPSEEDMLKLRERWGTDAWADETLDSPTLAGDEEFRIWNRNWVRLSASPSGAYAYWNVITEIEFRDIYPAVHVPTLVLYRAYRPDAREIYGDVARLIPDARLVELPGNDYAGIFLDEPAREIEAFVRPPRPRRARTVFNHRPLHRRGWLDRPCLGTRRRGLARSRRAASRARPPNAGAFSRDRDRYGGGRLLCHVRRPCARDPLRTRNTN